MAATQAVRVGSSVVFVDKYGHVHVGIISELHKPGEYGPHPAVTVQTTDAGLCLLPLAKCAPAGTPRAASMLAAKQHLPAGTLVRVSLPKGKVFGGMSDGDLGVVTADKGELVNVSKLGGNVTSRGEGYARLAHTALDVIDPAKVTISA